MDPARFRVVACGRRWGKTELGKVALLDCARRGGFGWWIAPSYGMADEVWRSLKGTLEDVWTDKDEQRRRIELPGGGVIQVRSGHEPDALRGAGLDLAVLDEAAFLPEGVWTAAVRPSPTGRGAPCCSARPTASTGSTASTSAAWTRWPRTGRASTSRPGPTP